MNESRGGPGLGTIVVLVLVLAWAAFGMVSCLVDQMQRPGLDCSIQQCEGNNPFVGP
jgi:hypothetical protein